MGFSLAELVSILFVKTEDRLYTSNSNIQHAIQEFYHVELMFMHYLLIFILLCHCVNSLFC